MAGGGGGGRDSAKECYPFNPPELTGSDPVSSGGLGGLDEKAAHELSSHFILISPPTHAKIPQAITARGTGSLAGAGQLKTAQCH